MAEAAPPSTPSRSGTRTRSTARPRGAARREALLEAALAIVAETGPDAVTHRRVAEAAGLPLASTTYYFASKEHLLTAALELAAARDITRLEAVIADRSAVADPLELITAVLLEPLAESGPSGRGPLLAAYALMLEAARRPALREIVARWTEAYVAALATLLQAAGSRQPRADAQLISAACDGLLIDQLASGVSADLRSRLRRLTRALLNAR